MQFSGISASKVSSSITVLRNTSRAVLRRVLFINVSGGAEQWRNYSEGKIPSNRLWGVKELLDRGYEVAFANSYPDFYLYRRPFPHDLSVYSFAQQWMRREDIVYCAHNTLYWLPFLRRLGLLKIHVVSLLYAREPLNLGSSHSGVLALTPAALEHIHTLFPRVKAAKIAWGMDLDFYGEATAPEQKLISCGRTNRDFMTLNKAVALSDAPLKLFRHDVPSELKWPGHVEFVEAGKNWQSTLPYRTLVNDHYARTRASVITLKADPIEETACGFTQLLEAMAMGRAAIVTKTGALPGEVDIEAEGSGLFVPAEDPAALAQAMSLLANDLDRCAHMGRQARKLCERYYNMHRFGADLHGFFESL